MTYGHLQADCLYTGISSGPNARCRVWESLYLLPFFIGSTRLSIPNVISIRSAVYAQLTAIRILYDGLLPPKIAPSHGGSGLPSTTLFLGPTRVYNPNGISISSAIFAGLTTMTDRQRYTQSATIGRSTTMLPKILMPNPV